MNLCDVKSQQDSAFRETLQKDNRDAGVVIRLPNPITVSCKGYYADNEAEPYFQVIN